MVQELCIQQEIVTISESVQLVQYTTLTVLSTIAYLRDLFPEEAFQDFVFAQLPLKQLKRGAISEADAFLDWIEIGCFDALSKNYLKEIVFGINCGPSDSSYVTETFSIGVQYFAQEKSQPALQFEHKNVPANREEFRGECGYSTEDIHRNVSKLLKSVCLAVQQLQQLSDSKCISMKLYFNDIAPASYQPPFFKDLDDSSDNFFKVDESNSLSFKFGATTTPFHGLELQMKTSKGKNSNQYKICPPKSTTPNLQLQPETQDLYSQIINPNDDDLISVEIFGSNQEIQKNTEVIVQKQEPTEVVCFDNNKFHKNVNNYPKENSKFEYKLKIQPEIFSQKDSQQKEIAMIHCPAEEEKMDVGIIRCMCNDTKSDGGMIMCDFCGFWQHCVCMGFTSLKDRRIPTGAFECYHCKFSQTPALQRYLASYCHLRRAIAFAVHESIPSVLALMKRLNISRQRSKTILGKLEREGIVVKLPEIDICSRKFNRYIYEAVRDERSRKVIADYFLVPIEETQRFKNIMKDGPIATESVVQNSTQKDIFDISGSIAKIALDENPKCSLRKKSNENAFKQIDNSKARHANKENELNYSIEKPSDIKTFPFGKQQEATYIKRLADNNDEPKSKRTKISIPIKDIRLNFKPCI